METPSISIRVTRSRSSSLKNSIPITGKNEENGVSRSRKGRADRAVLSDITNDSPIGGLAVGRLETPASSKIKSISCANIPKTPCSGEVLLRCQVKSLLQKVEEEETIENLKLSSEKLPFGPLRNLLNSPATLLAPTPANTPVIITPDLFHSTSSPANLIKEGQETVKILEVIVNPESYKSEESPISRTLLFVDSPGKTEMPDDSSMVSSTITCEDDDSSEWSVEVNASSPKDGHEEDEEEYQEGGRGLIDELCEEFQAICVEEKQGLLEFTGKHTRFIYNSDDEIEGEEDVASSPGVIRLKGIPTPKGRHIRFPEEEDGEN